MTAMRSSWVLLGSLVLALSLASCSSASTSNQKTAAPAVTTTAPVRACANDQMHVKYGRGLAGQGYQGAVIQFTNVSPIPCILTGYPVVVAVDSANTQTPMQQTLSGPLGGAPQGSSVIPVVHLGQDDSASAAIEAPAHPASGTGTCPRYVNLLIGLPGGSPVFQLPATLPDVGVNLSACQPPPQVHPFFPGFNGY
jgi:Protein of unknown function (DUF4232)